jgi:hypothetical protein
MVSVVPPAGAPTKILMGTWDWAWAQPEQAQTMLKARTLREIFGMGVMKIFLD